MDIQSKTHSFVSMNSESIVFEADEVKGYKSDGREGIKHGPVSY